MKKKTVKPKPKKKASATEKKNVGSKGKVGVKLLGERVLVRPLTESELGSKNSFGLIIPDTVDKEKSEQGIVVAVGPGKRTEEGKVLPMSVAIGNKVLFNKYGFDEVKVGGVEYYIVAEGNILAVLN